jgi:hypothetical protein
MYVVREASAPRYLDDGNPLAILPLELRIAVDRDLAQGEPELVARRVHDAAGCLAKMAARRAVERDLGKLYG